MNIFGGEKRRDQITGIQRVVATKCCHGSSAVAIAAPVKKWIRLFVNRLGIGCWTGSQEPSKLIGCGIDLYFETEKRGGKREWERVKRAVD